MEPIDKLIKALSKPDTILFIGSGVSSDADLPSWSDLLTAFSEYCENLNKEVAAANEAIRGKKYEFAAGLLDDQITRAERIKFFQSLEAFKDAVPQEIHKLILSFGLDCYITTNYDTLIEDAIIQEHPEKNIDVVLSTNKKKLAHIQTNTATNFIYKFHGDISNPESIVFTTQDYADLIHNNDIVKETLKTLMKTREVVMIGVGLNDRDVDLVLEEVKSLYDGNVDGLYALIGDVDESTCSFYKNNKGIDIISYNVLENDNHTNLLFLLEELYGKVSDNQLKAKTDDEVVRPQLKELLSDDDVSDILDRISGEDAEIRRMILSVIFWAGPINTMLIVGNISLLNSDIEEVAITSNLNWLIAENVLKATSNRIFPTNTTLIETVGMNRIDDAETLLGGNGGE